MIYAYRKRHRYTWLGLALLLPTGFILAFLAIPEDKFDTNELGFGRTEALTDVVKSKTGQSFKVNIRKEPNKSEQQLEVVLLQPLKSAATSVYLSAQSFEQITDGQFIGQLGPKGVYRYILDSLQSQYDPVHLLIYDPIKGQTIEQLSL